LFGKYLTFFEKNRREMRKAFVNQQLTKAFYFVDYPFKVRKDYNSIACKKL